MKTLVFFIPMRCAHVLTKICVLLGMRQAKHCSMMLCVHNKRFNIKWACGCVIFAHVGHSFYYQKQCFYQMNLNDLFSNVWATKKHYFQNIFLVCWCFSIGKSSSLRGRPCLPIDDDRKLFEMYLEFVWIVCGNCMYSL